MKRSEAGGSLGAMVRLGAAVVGFAAIGVGLVTVRQARLQAAHELTAASFRVQTIEAELLEARHAVASIVAPHAVAADGVLVGLDVEGDGSASGDDADPDTDDAQGGGGQP